MVERNHWPGLHSCLTPHTVRYQYVRILSSVHRWLHPQLPVLFCLVFISPRLQLQLFGEEAIDNKLIDSKKQIDEDALLKGRVINRKRDGVKLLGTGELKAKVDLKITKATKSAEEAVKKAGGSIEFIVIERKAVPRNHKKPRTPKA